MRLSGRRSAGAGKKPVKTARMKVRVAPLDHIEKQRCMSTCRYDVCEGRCIVWYGEQNRVLTKDEFFVLPTGVEYLIQNPSSHRELVLERRS